MSGKTTTLPPRRSVAVAAVLSSPTLEQAAAVIGVDVSTLRRWMKSPKFRAACLKAGKQIVGQTIGRIQSSALNAVATLERLQGCGNPAVELAAARSLISLALSSWPMILRDELYTAEREIRDAKWAKTLKESQGT